MKKFLAIFVAAFFLGGAASLFAQDQSAPPPDSQDSQATQAQTVADEQQQASAQPGMARVSMIQGNVSTQRGDNGQWSAATLNTPVAQGDTISTGDNSRAELQLNGSNVIRLSSDASVKVSTLNRNQIQLQVGEGLVTYSVLRGGNSASEIDTPNVAIRPQGEGQFRILVNNNAETQIVVRSGSADIATQQGSTTVTEGQMITVAGTDNPQYQTSNAPARDDWDNWNNDRDKVILDAQSWRDTNPNYTGSEDLDAYGHWQNVPDYGNVWVPTEPQDWAPYRTGRWVYEPYYGWTWVSYEPWGWAPYHYGRWFVYGGNWCWWPGPVAYYPGYYPLWAPAYVSFFGWGGGGWGFGIGFGFGWGWGHVGWLPCGPGDWYHPWYGRWGGGVHIYNYAGIHGGAFGHDGFGPLARPGAHVYSNFGDLHNNARMREGFTSMDSKDFGRGAVPGHQSGISEANLRQANFVSGRMGIEPSKASYSASGRSANSSTMRSTPSHMFNSSMASRTALARNSNGSRFGSSGNAQPRSDVRSQAQAPGRNGFSAPGSSNQRQGWQSFNNNTRGNTNGLAENRGSAANGQSRSFTSPQQNRGFSANNNERGFTGSPQQNSNSSSRSNWHTFTPPSNAGRMQESRGYSAPSQNTRGYQSPASGSNRSEGSSGYATRTPGYPQFNSPSSGSRGYSAPNQGYRGSEQPRSNTRGYSSNNYRPPLNLHQPVVQPRGYSAPSNRGGGYSAPSNRGGGGYRAPSSGGSHGGGGGGSHGGGGGSHGGRGR